jgi:drug/metabolite transporter (DMT)-like permease
MLLINGYVCRIFRIPVYVADPAIFRRMLMRGIVGSLSLSSLVYTVKHCSLSECIPIIYCSPIWTGIAGAFIFKESFGWPEIMTSVFGISGMCFIFKPKFLLDLLSLEGEV